MTFVVFLLMINVEYLHDDLNSQRYSIWLEKRKKNIMHPSMQPCPRHLSFYPIFVRKKISIERTFTL